MNIDNPPMPMDVCQIEVLCHYYREEGTDVDERQPPLKYLKESLELLQMKGLIEPNKITIAVDGTVMPKWKITKKGAAFVNMIRETPMPTESFIDPRTGRVI